ncbi:MAG: YceI family protein [Alphaproteobacteria bacterium]|nr:YceI family protein [Alphaproteobacteria bacterium SS10]
MTQMITAQARKATRPTALALFTGLILAAGAVFTAMPILKANAEPITVPSGTYVLDPTHASIIWKVSHLGLSDYTARFNRFDATVDFNVEDPAASSVQVSIDPTSVDTDYPNAETKDFNAKLAYQADFFDADQFPAITFTSTGIEVTGDRTAIIRGNLEFLGVSKEIALDTTMNGFLENHPFANIPAIGFSGTTTIDRTEWGMGWGQGAVGNEVEILIEAEFFKAQ